MWSESQDGNRRSVDLSRSDGEKFGEVANNIRRARIVHSVSVLESACLRELMCKRVSRRQIIAAWIETEAARAG